MSIKRITIWSMTFLRNMLSVKRCSLCKLVTVVLSTTCTWMILVLIDSSDVIQNFTSHVSRSFGGPTIMQWQPEGEAQKEGTQRFSEPSALLQDYLPGDNTGGSYLRGKDEGKQLQDSHSHRKRPRPLKAVMVFLTGESDSFYEGDKIAYFLSEMKIEHQIINITEPLPTLEIQEVPQFSLFIFQDYISYLSLDTVRRSILDTYCSENMVGILAFTESSRSAELEYFSGMGLKLQHRMKLRQFKFNSESDVWHLTRAESVYQESLPTSDWTVFITLHETFEPLAYSTVAPDWTGSSADIRTTEFGCVVAIHDVGLADGIERIVLGNDVDFFLNDVIAVDAIRYLTRGRMGLALERLLQIDVDDMFVGKVGIRIKAKDAEAMVASQERIAAMVPGFRYVLGYSGGMYLDGDSQEDLGDKKIVELASNFIWFDHMYRHLQPHMMSPARMLISMRANRKFAQELNIPVSTEYMVIPHHSGVYPVHEPLYDVWDTLKAEGVHITCTSTEQYPRLLPEWGRRGFVYRGVMVIPRQTCSLFTRTLHFENYPGGRTELDRSVMGGYLFKLFLHTPIMVFMTHMSNYGSDRLAPYAFERVLANLTKWTKIKVQSKPPCDIARRYFQMYPEEITPLWTNPCNYFKHMEIWPPDKSCKNLPAFIIVGPQKTGTTALYSFLSVHPSLATSFRDPVHWEEVQFFNGKEYLNGFDWYMNRFPQPTQPNTKLFEKSANYFDSDVTPRRIFSLIPKAKIVVITIEPGHRAYSWYQHLRSHKDPIALNHTFYEVISVPESGPKTLKDVRNRCLRPGMYAVHLEKWLQVFPKEQILLVDGDRVIKDPVTVMNQLQRFVGVKPFIDYKTKLRYDSDKGFYCLIESGCLSPSKGRKYDDMDAASAQFLQKFYQEHNIQLRDLLTRLGRPPPQWLVAS